MKAHHGKKVIWIIDGLGHGGAEQLTGTIISHLRNKFHVRVCALQVREDNPIAAQLESIGVPVDFVSIPRLRTLSNIPSLVTYLRKHSPDLVHTQLQFSDILGSIAAKILNIPTVSTQHVIEPLDAFNTAKMRQSLNWFCLKYISKTVIAVSEQTRQYIITQGKIDPSKVITIHNGIEVDKFNSISKEKSNSIREKHLISPKDKLILSVAVLRKQKGIQYMISALPEILKSVPNLKYLVVGDGSYYSQLSKIVEEKKVQKSIIFAGHQPNVPEYMAASDIFVLPTEIDAFPTVLMETLAAKCPSVASNVGGVPEIIEHETTGLLVPPQNPEALSTSCLRLLQNPELANAIAENGYKAVTEKFDISVQINNLEKLYLDILNDA